MRRSYQRSPSGPQAGFTLIEVIVAALILTGAMFTVLVALQGARKAGETGVRETQEVALAQQEIERIKGLSFSQIALSGTRLLHTDVPGGTPNPNNPPDPTYYVDQGGTNFKILTNYHDLTSSKVPGTPSAGEPLAFGGSIVGGPESAAVGATTVRVWRFVSERQEPPLLNVLGLGILCPPLASTSRRITIAVLPTAASNQAGPSRPVYVSSIVDNPNPPAPVPVGGPLLCSPS